MRFLSPIRTRGRRGSVLGLILILGLACCQTQGRAGTPVRLLLAGQGPDGHPPTAHEFMAGTHVLSELLKPYTNIQVTITKADEPWSEGPKLIDAADGVVMLVTQGARWMQTDPERFAAFKRLGARGGAFVGLHWSVGAKEAKFIPGQLALLGATRGGEQRKYTVMEAQLKRVAPQHPVLAGIGDFRVYDEFYYALDQAPGIQPLQTAFIDGKDETATWVWERPDGGRSFGFVCLHFHSNWQMPEYRRLVLQGVLWSLKQPTPPGGVNVDIAARHLELEGVLPPLAHPGMVMPARKPDAK